VEKMRKEKGERGMKRNRKLKCGFVVVSKEMRDNMEVLDYVFIQQYAKALSSSC
jgi:hypothetical protein